MSKALYILPALLIFISSCKVEQAQQEPPTGDDRSRDIRRQENRAYTGRVLNFTGIYTGECSGEINGEILSGCEAEVEVIQRDDKLSVYVKVSSQGYGSSNSIIDFNIVLNKIVDDYTGRQVGQIGQGGFKYESSGNRFRFLLSSVSGVYFDAFYNGRDGGQVKANLTSDK